MTRLAQTIGLTEIQTEIVSAVRHFVDTEIIPSAHELERADAYPTEIVAAMREMGGLFGLMIPEQYGAWGGNHSLPTHCASKNSHGGAG